LQFEDSGWTVFLKDFSCLGWFQPDRSRKVNIVFVTAKDSLE